LRARDRILELDRAKRKAEAEAREAIEALALPRGNAVDSAHFSPDGQQVVTVSAGGTVRVWDAQTGKPLTASGAGADSGTDGGGIVTVSPDGTARVWDAETGKPLVAP
jgi:WD40 repeat protein